MKNIFLILLLTIPLCHAQPPKNPTISPDYDSLKAVVSNLDKSQKEIKNLIDSLNGKFISDNFVTVKSTEKMQELHNVAFDKMQKSFNIFIIAVGVIITTLTLISTILNIKIATDSKKEVKEELEKIKDFENHSNEQIENQKNEFLTMRNELKNDIDKDKNNLMKVREEIFRVIANSYIRFSWDSFYKNDIFEHFTKLSAAFDIFNRYKIDLDDIDLEMFDVLDEIFEYYKEEYLNNACIFLDSFADFMINYGKMKKFKIVEKAKKTWDKLCSKLGGEEKVFKSINDYRKDGLEENKNGKRTSKRK